MIVGPARSVDTMWAHLGADMSNRDLVVIGRDAPEPQRPGDGTQVADMVALNGPPSPIACPACGALWQTGEDAVVRDACHVGRDYKLKAKHVRQLPFGQRDRIAPDPLAILRKV